MRLYSYVITHDSGFAPNPYGGILTLATCKPDIRRGAQPGDVVVANGSAGTYRRDALVYAAVIKSVVPWCTYGSSSGYAFKRPTNTGDWRQRCGDNIYYIQSDGWARRDNDHHTTDALMRQDLSGVNVLVCKEYWYYGAEARAVERPFRRVIKRGRKHKVIDDMDFIEKFLDWLRKERRGVHGRPIDGPDSCDGDRC